MYSRILNRAIFILVLFCLMAFAGVARADLKATNVAYAWERPSSQFQNSNVTVIWDGGWVPFIHELDFDNDLYGTCNGTGTRWAGSMDFGLYHTDDAPAGALGFQETRRWSLVDCDRNGDGRFNNTDRSTTPAEDYYENPSYFILDLNPDPAEQDVVTPCSTGNCFNEIVTTLNVDLDTDCDGNKDASFPELVCFYAEARVPDTTAPAPWSGPLQARISVGGGDKTVNFNPEGPNAITLLGLNASSNATNAIYITVAGLVVLFITWPLYQGIKRKTRRAE